MKRISSKRGSGSSWRLASAAAIIALLAGLLATTALARASEGTLPPPTIQGAPYKGSTLTCTPAQPADPAMTTWSWSRDGTPVPDVTTPTYVVTGADVDHRLGCTETVTANGVTETASSAEVEIIRVTVQLIDQTKRVQPGPTLKVWVVVTAEGPPPVGTLLLNALRGTRAVTVARTAVPGNGRFLLGQTIWGLVPGRLSFRVEFVPADPELHQPAEQLDTIRAVSPATYPFARTFANRRPTLFDGLTQFWSDGRSCSVGCRPPGAINGWPLKPFQEQHMLRAGLNELRPSGFHLGIDIMALERQNVYAIQSGYAHILQRRGIGARVRIGNYIYWHVKIFVHEGQYVRAYETVVGRMFAYYVRHLHLSEVGGSGGYLNPLRPGGRVLSPWTDYEPPVIGAPQISGDGSVTVDAFDPQSFAGVIYYATPVLAPAALAYRLFTAAGTPITPLQWALRGSQRLPFSLLYSVFTPDAHSPGFLCFAHLALCIPHWRYHLAGGLAPRLPLGALHSRTRLTIYAWDWAGNITARDTWLNG